MKRTTIVAVVLASALAIAGCTSERHAQYDRGRPSGGDTLAMMKKQDVISMSKAGVSDSLIITMLAVSDSWFQLKAQDVIELKNAGVSDRVIDAMIETNTPLNEFSGSASGYSGAGYYYYPPYYWYGGYYPLWYYPSFYLGYGYNYYRPFYRQAVIHRQSYFGNYGFHGGRGGGGRRR
jgi:hypothetical protein